MRKWLLLPVLLTGCLWSQLALAGVYAYVPNAQDGTVSVIDTATNTEILPQISVGSNPIGVAASPDGLLFRGQSEEHVKEYIRRFL